MRTLTMRWYHLAGVIALLVLACAGHSMEASEPISGKAPSLPAYAPEKMASSGPIHRGLSVVLKRTLKGHVIAISPDNLSAITVAPAEDNTVYDEAVCAGGR